MSQEFRIHSLTVVELCDSTGAGGKWVTTLGCCRVHFWQLLLPSLFRSCWCSLVSFQLLRLVWFWLKQGNRDHLCLPLGLHLQPIARGWYKFLSHPLVVFLLVFFPRFLLATCHICLCFSLKCSRDILFLRVVWLCPICGQYTEILTFGRSQMNFNHQDFWMKMAS